jgi:glycosyltransferase involved in cell wall biosynthesis
MPPIGSDYSKFRFLLVARMLHDKGVGEYAEAARLLRQRWPCAKFYLMGFLDVKNPAAISRAEMDTWVAEGAVNYLGESDDVRSQIAAADCVVLPSYREGIPRSLLEAAAMARPIITTDTVGCREVVDDGVNGYLCKVRDSEDLAKKMEQMLALSPEARAQMGQRGREKVEREFDERIVIGKYLEAIAEVLSV